MPIINSERDQIVQLIRRWGGLAADALLDPSTKFFQVPEIEGLIGYRILSKCAVVFGDPICSPADRDSLSEAFDHYCKEQPFSIVYLIASESFAKWAMHHTCNAMVQFGTTLFVNPQNDPRELHGAHASLVRRKVRHAIGEGVTVNEYVAREELTEKAMIQAAKTWLQNRRGPQVHISHVYLFDDRLGKRWFYAMKNGKIVGIVVLNLLESCTGWLMNHMMITPDAPQGTPELLVVSALEVLKQEGCTYATFGAVPDTQLGEISGLGSFSAWTARMIYRAAYHLFHLNGHKMFWGKFQPETAPSYLLFSRSQIGPREIKALFEAMNVSIK